MEKCILGSLSILALLAPIVFALYLIAKKLKLSYIKKPVLNLGSVAINGFSFVIFCIILFLIKISNTSLNVDFNFITIHYFSLDFGIYIDEFNSLFLIFSSLIATLIAYYSKIYFEKKKNFIFTKQRYYAFLNIIAALAYLFFASVNLAQSIVLLLLISASVLIFSYFDIFKNESANNITRFFKIDLIGNFSLLLAGLILFKYCVLSYDYMDSNSLNYNELNLLISYTQGISFDFEFIIIVICFTIFYMTKLSIFPFNYYWSFFANSSNLLYLCVYSLLNNLIGVFMLFKIQSAFELMPVYKKAALVIAALSIAISLIQIFFEKNTKIIFGYLSSIYNSLFLVLFISLKLNRALILYFVLGFFAIVYLMILFYFDKTNIKKRLVNKQVGFLLEKSYIVIFESLSQKVTEVFDFIDEKITQNIINIFIWIFNFLTSIFVIKTMKDSDIKSVKNILIIFAFFVLICAFIALYGRYKC